MHVLEFLGIFRSHRFQLHHLHPGCVRVPGLGFAAPFGDVATAGRDAAGGRWKKTLRRAMVIGKK